MDHRNALEKYIKKAGGYEAAAAILGCAEVTLRSVITGWRGVGKLQAEKWEAASGGLLRARELVWIKATKEPAKRKPRKAGRHGKGGTRYVRGGGK